MSTSVCTVRHTSDTNCLALAKDKTHLYFATYVAMTLRLSSTPTTRHCQPPPSFHHTGLTPPSTTLDSHPPHTTLDSHHLPPHWTHTLLPPHWTLTPPTTLDCHTLPPPPLPQASSTACWKVSTVQCLPTVPLGPVRPTPCSAARTTLASSSSQ